MIDYDYGKRAYIKVMELEEKLEKFIKETESQKEKVLTFDLSVPEKKAVFSRSLKFKASVDGIVSVTAVLNAPESLPLIYELYKNDEVIKSGKTTSTETIISFELGVFSGENELVFSVSAGIPFTLDGLKVTVNGKVDYLSCKRRISLITVGEENWITYLNENTVTLYNYKGESLIEKYSTSVYDACILGYVNGELYLGFISADYGLKIMIYRTSTGSGFTTKALVNGVSSICGYPSGNVVNVLYIKTGKVFKGVYDRGSGYTEQSTFRRGTSVYADPDVSGVYVISDGYKPTKFIVQEI